MNSQASQSSNSGCDGISQRVPKSSGVSTRPLPKYVCQTRFTNARAVVGDFRSTSHFAKVSREPSASGGSGCRNAGTPNFTSEPGFSQSPRLNR